MMTRIFLFCFLLLQALSGNAQRRYSLSILSNSKQLPITSFRADWKQRFRPGITTGFEFHRIEKSLSFQPISIGFNNCHLVPLVLTFNARVLRGEKLFFYPSNQLPKKEFNYYFRSLYNQSSKFSIPYRVSDFSYGDQPMRFSKLDIWLPPKTEKQKGEFVGSLLYTALSVYSSFNQHMTPNDIDRGNFTIIKK